MALKLRRRLEVFTNGMLAHRRSGCEQNSMSGGAASFKRVLGGSAVHSHLIGNTLLSADG